MRTPVSIYVTCTGSLYLWDQPLECLAEIFRILKPGCEAILFETTRGFDEQHFRHALRKNLRGESILHRWLTPYFLGKQLNMTYTADEIAELLHDGVFGGEIALSRITLAGIPIWMKIRLLKPG